MQKDFPTDGIAFHGQWAALVMIELWALPQLLLENAHFLREVFDDDLRWRFIRPAMQIKSTETGLSTHSSLEWALAMSIFPAAVPCGWEVNT